MSAPIITIKKIELRERPVHMRLPFHFGSTCVKQTAQAFVRITVESATGLHHGISAQLMVPRWFDKREGLSNDDTIDELRWSAHLATELAVGTSGSVRALSKTIRTGVLASALDGQPALACGFGPAVLEAAMIDAVCKSLQLSFAQAARADLFGLCADVPADLSADGLSRALKTINPASSIAIRHTIGFHAPLVSSDIAERPDDDLPVALDEVIAATGVSAFKIKLKGDVDADIAWLEQLVALLERYGRFEATLDANEQYDPHQFEVFLDRFLTNPKLATLKDGLHFIEQPFAREKTLQPCGGAFDFPIPVIIDESDDHDDALPQALALGWSGTSVKSCKSILRGLLNYGRVKHRQEQGLATILSCEDLTCQAGLGWQQDTLLAACLGARHIERNGHHFVGAMQGASKAEQNAFLAAHPYLYQDTQAGPYLSITNGVANIASLLGPGFASSPSPDFTNMQTMPKPAIYHRLDADKGTPKRSASTPLHSDQDALQETNP